MRLVITVVAALLTLAGCAGGSEPSPPLATPGFSMADAIASGSPPSAPLPVLSPTVPSGPVDTIGGGTYVVGSDIVSGTYRTLGPVGSSPCYWARLKDTTGDFDAIIANELTDGPTTVTIKKSDGAFRTARCTQWTKVD